MYDIEKILKLRFEKTCASLDFTWDKMLPMLDIPLTGPFNCAQKFKALTGPSPLKKT